MVMSIPHSDDVFSPEAATRWTKVPEWAQERILANVWCGKCRGSVAIILESAQMDNADLVFRGKCQKCGNSVCRVIEPEIE